MLLEFAFYEFIKVNFPDFYHDLQEDPALLQRITDVMIRGKSIKDQPLLTRQLLTERYFHKLKDDDGDISYEVRKEHRPLRQFLASLIGLRWPASLQSLLLLSEDPISRKFGEKAAIIYAAFISGDTQGVLEGFGRHIDATVLKQNEARLLYQMAEDLRHERSLRRTSASRVIADLVDRLPQDTAQLLLGSLCRELGDSADLRSQLGIEKIEKILRAAHADDQRAVVSRLVEDVLTTEEDIRFRLETMEPPNLEEAVAFAEATVNLSLAIRRDHGLAPEADTQLLSWLVDRTVRINGKSHQFPFEEFEQWMTDHEDHLLLALADRYSDLLAAELESEAVSDFDTTQAIRRVNKVFSTLWDFGEDTRPILWKNIIRYVTLKLPEASQAAWKVMAGHVTSPNTSQITEFIIAFIGRLRQEAEENEWSIDLIQSAAQTLLTLVRTRITDIDNDALHELSELAILWSNDDDTSSLSCDVVNELLGANMEKAQHVFDNWAKRILEDLPIDCIMLIASVFPKLESSAQSSIIAQLDPVISTATIDESTGEKYAAFVKTIPDDAWDINPLKTHLDSLLPQIAARHNNPNNYLNHIFPAIVTVLHHASPGPLGQSLNSLFTQAKGQPKHYARLHSYMAEHWPKPSADLNPYDPTQIFRNGCDFALAQPQSSSKGLLMSLQDMLSRGLVPADQRTALIEATCATWTSKPEQAVDTITDGYSDLTPEQAANLVDNIDWNIDEQKNFLTRAWSSVVQSQDADEHIQTTTRLLGKGISGPENEPDQAIRLWLDAQGKQLQETLQTTLIQEELNDVHRKRLWLQAIQFVESLSSQFFLDVIPKISSLSSVEETTNRLFADYDVIVNVLDTIDKRAELSKHLMEIFPDVATNTVKSHIAAWCQKLNGDAALQVLSPEMLTDEDMNILKSHLGKTSALKKLEKARTTKS